MQTSEDRHLTKREKKNAATDTRASRKRQLATVKRDIGNADPKSHRVEELREDHTRLCKSLKRGV